MIGYLRAAVCVVIFGFVVVLPVVHFRQVYTHSKRLRVVVPGRVYRSGQMTVAGFEEHLKDLGIRTVVNLQDEYPDPDLARGYFDRSSVKESEVCRRLGVKYVFIAPDLVPHRQAPARRPEAIEKMLAIFDNSENYPVLLHCKAGLHRTGCMVALYRMEYQGWSPERVVAEMRANGFAASDCTSANEYIYQYVTTYRPGFRLSAAGRLELAAQLQVDSR